MIRSAYELQSRANANFRHFFDRNALTFWAAGIAVLAVVLTLPALI